MTLRSFISQRLYFGAKPQAEAGARPNRGGRRLITGAGLNAQKCRLLLTAGDGAQTVYPCRITDVANGGYCISVLGAELPPSLAGTEAVLEQSDKSCTPVELRWVDGPKIGLKRLARERPAP